MLNTKIENPVTSEVRTVTGFLKVKNDRQAENFRQVVEECSEGSMNVGNVRETVSVVQRRRRNA